MIAMLGIASRCLMIADADAKSSETNIRNDHTRIRFAKELPSPTLMRMRARGGRNPTDVMLGMFLIFGLNRCRMSPRRPECAQSRVPTATHPVTEYWITNR